MPISDKNPLFGDPTKFSLDNTCFYKNIDYEGFEVEDYKIKKVISAQLCQEMCQKVMISDC